MKKHEMGFKMSSPEAQGMPSSAILAFLNEAERQYVQIDGLIIMRNNYIITEGYYAPFSKEKRHRLFSAGKAVVALAIMFAIQEKLLNENDKVINLLPDNLPENISENLSNLTLYHLLTMTAGHEEDSFGTMLNSENREKAFFEAEFVYAPGTHFLYDNGIPDILSFILFRATGKGVLDYLKPRLFEPLNITQMQADKNGVLDELPTMCCTTREFFKLTLFFANEGMFNGNQLLDKKLMQRACSCQTPSLQVPSAYAVAHDTKFGYGYQIWRNSVGGFRLDGGRGQFGVVIPHLNLVIAIHSSEEDQDIVLKLLWQFITNKIFTNPLAANDEVFCILQNKLSELTLAPAFSKVQKLTQTGYFKLEKPCLGCGAFEILQDNNFIDFKLHGVKDTCFTVNVLQDFRKIKAPFNFHPKEAANGVRRLDMVHGYSSADVYTCARILSANTFELHFRCDAWMNGYILYFTFANEKMFITVETTLGRNLRLRSPWLCAEALKSQLKYQPMHFSGIACVNSHERKTP